MTAWSDLPNAAHIDRVIESVKKHPLIWVAARDEAWNAARDAAWVAARDEAWNAAWNAARLAARGAALYAANGAANGAARAAAWSSIAALIAWDDSDRFLDMTSDELIVWIRLSSDPAAALMLPAVNAFEQIAILETV